MKVFRLFRLERTFLVFGVWTQLGPEWTSTHQWTNVDGWCTDRIVFSIPVPSQVHGFCLPVLSPDQPWSQVLFATLFSHHLAPVFFFFFCFLDFSHPLTHYPPLSLTDLLTYIFDLKVDSSPFTYSPINLKCATLILTYMATPTYMVVTKIDPHQATTMRKE